MSKERPQAFVFVTSSGGVVARRCFFATPPAAYANPLWCCDAASRLHNGGEVAQFLHKTSYALCDASLLSHTAVAALRVA
ncbi:hypothetical protein [Thiothrix fructosivorans]|uniref:Uncharacterized protein n=1 Tax=Thiothrix fructosivorans TaxID=111770 RepID=A0A8B0SNN7_9GAMM|nr:hypothetical protein [Thiothrix fructosivorans]MBO0611344.1 hypothetical protein [Thiothrix fructosivorans]QTX12936.1 hypothetical protein J1836_020100 [Thiothrix fructosivorans]